MQRMKSINIELKMSWFNAMSCWGKFTRNEGENRLAADAYLTAPLIYVGENTLYWIGTAYFEPVQKIVPYPM